LRHGNWPQRLHDVEELEDQLIKQARAATQDTPQGNSP
jgi:hypothetical protein